MVRKGTRSARDKANHHVYTVKTRDGKYYTGRSTNVASRIDQHTTGQGGARCLKGKEVVAVVYKRKCRNLAEAKRAETQSYYYLKDRKGSENVRGAGNTRRF